jgi:hypothetical protein
MVSAPPLISTTGPVRLISAPLPLEITIPVSLIDSIAPVDVFSTMPPLPSGTSLITMLFWPSVCTTMLGEVGNPASA